MLPSLINFDKKGPENQLINFAWPKIFLFILKKKCPATEICIFFNDGRILHLLGGTQPCLFRVVLSFL